MRTTLFATLGIAAIALSAACASDSLTSPERDDASAAVDIFTRLADSVARSGGDADLGSAYGSLAEAVRQGGRVSPIVVAIDGTPTTFLATAQQTEVITAPCGDLAKCPTFVALRPVVLRTFVAWQQDDPKRIIQIASAADSEPIRAYLHPVLVPSSGPSASLVYFDGKGGTFFGSNGAQKVSITTSSDACSATGEGKRSIDILPALPRCTRADFSISFSATAEPSTFLVSRNTATGSHTFSTAAQPVLGSRFERTAVTSPLPPITVTPSATLSASLSAKVDSVVTLTLTITNPTDSPVDVSSGSSQTYEFTILDAATGARVWRWSDGRAFTLAFVTRTLAAHGSLTFTEQWKPTQKGTLVALGSLVSASHRADAKASISVP